MLVIALTFVAQAVLGGEGVEASARSVNVYELIRDGRALANAHGDSVWPGYSAAPDSLILIDGEEETLLCHEGLADGFQPAPVEAVTGCNRATRDRVFPPALLASFPAVDGTPTIVIGTPEATNRSQQDWMITLLHEHFHQMQDSVPGIYQQSMALNLHNRDQTGMWMLNYDFPYQDAVIAQLARDMADLALETLAANDNTRDEVFSRYMTRRNELFSAVSAADQRYYELQVWKEGVARWTELAILRQAALSDNAYADLVQGQADRMLRDLGNLDMAADHRVSFYALGSAEAEILQRTWPQWRDHYFEQPFDMGILLNRALTANSPAAESD